MIFGIIGKARASVGEAVRGAVRQLLLREVDRVLGGLFEPGVEQYDVKGADGEVHSLSPDAFLAVVTAIRTRFRVEL